MYPPSYHTALNALIRNAPRSQARPLIARALRTLRATPCVHSGRAGKTISGRQWARQERDHMLYVNAQPWSRK